MIPRPSYHNGFAPRNGVARYPDLWRDRVLALCARLGPTGLRVVDWSPGRQNGELTNMQVGTSWIVEDGYALDFDGADDYLSVPHTQALSLSDAWTIAGWVKPNSPTASYAALLSKPHTSFAAPYNMLGLQAWASVNTPPRMVMANAGTEFTLSATSVLPNLKWSHIACSFHLGRCRIFVNGREENTVLQGFSAVQTNTANIGIGGVSRSGQLGDHLKGRIDDVGLWRRALQASEIALLASRRAISYEIRRPISARVLAATSANRRRRILIGA